MAVAEQEQGQETAPESEPPSAAAILARAQAMRADDSQGLPAAAEALGQALGDLTRRCGSDVHESLADVWLEYGDVLLELEEERGGCDEQLQANGEHNRNGEEDLLSALQQADVPASDGRLGTADSIDAAAAGTEGGKEDAEAEEEDDADDLQVAWECLEMARQCFELRLRGGAAATVSASSTATAALIGLSRTRCRLADLLLLQRRPLEAVDEGRAAVQLQNEALASEGGSDNKEAIEAARAETEARITLALVQAARLARSLQEEAAAGDAKQEDDKRNDDQRQAQRQLQPETTADEFSGFGPPVDLSGKLVHQLPVVRRKRPLEETNCVEPSNLGQ